MFSLTLLDLSLQKFLSDIPHDADAIVVLLLLALLVGFTIHGSRGKGSGSPKPPRNGVETAEPPHAPEPREPTAGR